MCGRFSLFGSIDDLRSYFKISVQRAIFDLPPRYNVAPSQQVAVVRVEEGERRLALLRWGLVPFWAESPKVGYRMINARAESAHKTPAFRAAFRKRRCIIPASGFFEWEHEGKAKRPFFIYRKDGAPLAFAGLWEYWEGEEKGEARIIESCAILTTTAAGPVAKLHNRMPVILEPEDFDRWLDPAEEDKDNLSSLLKPPVEGMLDTHPVSKYVNKPDHEGKECIEKGAVSSASLTICK